ncbi:MAG: adenosine-specific kinase [Acidobacteria bacterium]|nr:adenosine-specific kinase [Acidobacteriota bacterium]
MNIFTVEIEKPEATNFVLGQSHFIKTVEDLHEAIATTAPHLRFGIAFCESSGPALVRRSGNDEGLIALAVKNAQAVGAGHSFFVFLDNGFPVSILNTLKAVPEVCRIYCATANPAEVVVAETETGRAILGVVDGVSPRGVEGPDDVAARISFLRKIGYKLG